MAFGWAGATPVAVDDGAGTYLELGETYTAVGDITITAVRVWHGASSQNVPGRRARIWTTGGAVLAEVDIDASLPAGWTEYTLDAPLERTAGQQFVVSYSTRQFYGAVAGGYPASSADAVVTISEGRFTENIGFLFPATVTASFYGVDIVYTAGIGGNVAPVVTLEVSVELLEATATVEVVDEAPGSVAYVYDWGDGSTTSTSSTTAVHTYATHGLYAVFVVATDAAGAKGVDAVPVVVNAPGGGMDVEAVLDELADRLRTIDGLEVWDSVPDRISAVPAAVVALPDTIDFDAGGRRSTDMMSVPVLVVFSRIVPRVGKRELGAFASGHGARSVKTVLESGVYTTFRGIIVQNGTFERVDFGGVAYLAVVLTARIGG